MIQMFLQENNVGITRIVRHQFSCWCSCNLKTSTYRMILPSGRVLPVPMARKSDESVPATVSGHTSCIPVVPYLATTSANRPREGAYVSPSLW